MIDRDVALLLIGAVALVSSLVAALVQHFLSLRADRIKREGDGQEREAAEADDLLDRAIEVVRKQNRASTSLLQRKLRIGYPRAAHLIDLMEA